MTAQDLEVWEKTSFGKELYGKHFYKIGGKNFLRCDKGRSSYSSSKFGFFICQSLSGRQHNNPIIKVILLKEILHVFAIFSLVTMVCHYVTQRRGNRVSCLPLATCQLNRPK